MQNNATALNPSVRLTQAIPHLGEIQVDLLEPAASIYNAYKENEIRRLQGLMQLGLLSRIHSGAHHTRWDYIMLKLYLLKTFKDACVGSGLSSEVPCLNLDSGDKAIQAYILLRNYGHLKGCFETERLVLECCIEHARVRDMLLKLTPHGFKEWGMQLIADESIFKFYQLLAVIFIANGSEFKKEDKLKKECLKLLYRFLVEPDNRIQILKDRHREIRTLAYLALDMHYAVTGLEFNLGAILLGAKEFGRKMFTSSESSFQILTRQIDSYIGDTVYRTSDATWLFVEYRRKMYLRISRPMLRFSTSRGFFQFLKRLKWKVYDFNPNTRPVYAKLLLGTYDEYREPDKTITQTRTLADRLKIQPIGLGLACVPSRTPSHIYIFFRPNIIRQRRGIAQTYRLILEELVTSRDAVYRGHKPVVSTPFREISISLDSVFRSILYLLTNDEYEIVIDRAGLHTMFKAVCERGKGEALRRMSSILRMFKSLPRSRKAELECIAAAVRKAYGGTIALCLSNIKILRKPQYRQENEEYEATEIDGAILIANKLHTKLLLVESKTTHRNRTTAARRQLENLYTQKVRFTEAFKDGIEEAVLLPGRGAYLPIRLF